MLFDIFQIFLIIPFKMRLIHVSNVLQWFLFVNFLSKIIFYLSDIILDWYMHI
jgi:hypothetical protein